MTHVLHASRDLADAFASVESWIFDLDNTLYPPHTDLFAQVDAKITGYISDFLGLDRDEAYRLQKQYYKNYGTSLRGMMVEHGMDPHDFLDVVHDIDHSPLEPDPALGAALAALPGRKFVLTNGSRGHAEKVTRALGINDEFEDMFGIVEAKFAPKPAKEPYDIFLTRNQIAPAYAVMFEDLARNLLVPKQLGMRTTLVTDRSLDTRTWRAAWEDEGSDAEYVDFVTDDLAQFLVSIIDAVAPEKAIASR
ncbi:MAG: pyrimidine 5'-nucleotidase [Pseudomonadota bacterium]